MKLPKFLKKIARKNASKDDSEIRPGVNMDLTEEDGEKTSSPLEIIYSGHRGSGANITQSQRTDEEQVPENSIASFRKALEQGATSIEFDVYRANDGVLMVAHDNDISSNAMLSEKAAFDIKVKERAKNDPSYSIDEIEEIIQKLYKDKPPSPTPIAIEKYYIENYSSKQIQDSFDISYIPILSKELNKNGNLDFHGHIRSGVASKENAPDTFKKEYQQMPTFESLLDLVAEENVRRKDRSEPNVILNMELKGFETGELVKHELDKHSKKNVSSTINPNDIHFLAFDKDELLNIAKDIPKANIVLGVPTNDTYSEVGPDYTIINHKLQTNILDKKVIGFDKELRNIPGRNRGLDGVDVSLWDIGDEVLEYYGKHKIPVHVAVTPWGPLNLEQEYLKPAISNINKIAKFQGRFYDEGQKPFIFVKTDAPIELQEIVERSKSSQKNREVLDASEYVIESLKGRGPAEIPIYQRPQQLFRKKLQQNDEQDIDKKGLSK